jgi:hypothetical protein
MSGHNQTFDIRVYSTNATGETPVAIQPGKAWYGRSRTKTEAIVESMCHYAFCLVAGALPGGLPFQKKAVISLVELLI